VRAGQEEVSLGLCAPHGSPRRSRKSRTFVTIIPDDEQGLWNYHEPRPIAGRLDNKECQDPQCKGHAQVPVLSTDGCPGLAPRPSAVPTAERQPVTPRQRRWRPGGLRIRLRNGSRTATQVGVSEDEASSKPVTHRQEATPGSTYVAGEVRTSPLAGPLAKKCEPLAGSRIGVMLRPVHQVSKAAAVMGRERWYP
jgi:hypothetical protein